MKPLDQLDEVPWSTLEHAYGTAEDVPELLRRLETEPAETKNKESALWHLFSNIWHQGTVYEATSFAVPFLLTLVANPEVPKRARIAGLLSAIANGQSYLDVHEGIFENMGLQDTHTEAHQEQKAKELEWVAKAKAEVAKGVELFVELSEDDSDLGRHAAEALSHISEFDDRAGKRLIELVLSAKDPVSKALFLLMLARTEIDDTRQMFVDRLTSDETVVRRAATAACLIVEHAAELPLFREQMMEVILDSEFESRLESVPFEYGEFSYLPRICAHQLSETEKPIAIESLCDQLENQKCSNAQAEILLDLAFPTNGEKLQRVKRKNLSEVQRCVLEGLQKAASRKAIHIQTPQKWGLPQFGTAMKKLLG